MAFAFFAWRFSFSDLLAAVFELFEPPLSLLAMVAPSRRRDPGDERTTLESDEVMENTACTSGRARKTGPEPFLLIPLRDLPERWPLTSQRTAGPDTRTPSTMLLSRRSSTLYQEDVGPIDPMKRTARRLP